MSTALLVILTLAVGVVLGGPASHRLRPNSVENIERLNNLKPTDLSEELSGQFEGDIVLSQEQEDTIFSRKKNGRVDLAFRWPDNEIPYEIVTEHFNCYSAKGSIFVSMILHVGLNCFTAADQVAHIERGIRLIEQQSCLRFRPRKDDTEGYIRVIGNDSGCWSWVGFLNNGMQELHLNPGPLDTGCFRMGTIVHEFLHALGFFHMQSASDRDDFVEIKFEHLIEGTENNFYIYTEDQVSGFNVMYDYGSVMHYGRTAFSKNGEDTIIPKIPNAEIGQRVGMSERDISKLNIMYRCLNKN